MVQIIITGAAGRMGRALLESVLKSDGVELLGATVRPNSSFAGFDAGDLVGLGSSGVPLTENLNIYDNRSCVVIDFTNIEASLDHVDWCVNAEVPLVIGTTGFSEKQESKIRDASNQIPIVHAPNFSVGVNVVFHLLDRATRLLGKKADIEILEAHHRDKLDAPSGTALALGKIAANALNCSLDDVATYGREGQIGARPQSQIGFATLRAGDIVGEHTVLLACEGERVEISHKATNRQTFSNGAVSAAIWVEAKKPGLYSMRDVLGV